MARFTKIYVSEKDIPAAKAWCRQYIGPAKPTKKWNSLQWYHRSFSKIEWQHREVVLPRGSVFRRDPRYVQRECIFIRDEELATMFALRWS